MAGMNVTANLLPPDRSVIASPRVGGLCRLSPACVTTKSAAAMCLYNHAQKIAGVPAPKSEVLSFFQSSSTH